MVALILTLLVAATVGAVAFPVLYVVAFRWPDTPAGRAALILGASLAFILTLTCLGRVAGVRFDPWVALVAYLILTAGVWWQLLTLIFYIRRRRNTRRQE